MAETEARSPRVGGDGVQTHIPQTGAATNGFPSAHGKAILFGEHAVVYGRPALAVGLPDGLRCTALRPTPGRLRVRAPRWGLDADDRTAGMMGDVMRRLRRRMPGGERGCVFDLDPRLPAAAGLGSSAALAVVLVRGLARVRGLTLTDDEVRVLAHQLEEVFHGQPSGLDDTVATFGGLCLFRKGGWPSATSGAPLTGEARQLPFAAPSLVIGNSDEPRSTRRMVQRVLRQRRQDRPRVEALFGGMEGCLRDGLAALENDEPTRMGAAMDRNQRLLAALGLSSPTIDTMVRLAKQAGALGAKLTGAGGGGCVLAFAPGHEDAVIEAWRDRGWRGWRVGGEEAA